ncbi:hypothetical protein Poli38472_013622 [Pythium oligandrum]|uniref:Temptin Cys/Cys disulfide domain-containing protein n=1 Tax=Pythium oligandrum TaxID=41045 RepID=A0A8K1CDP9_PYTOL|nr:hypothetical protein Poli38472_013622 [Pythium oligandrum]|eukprot:TMW61159.1 hypothetical protein Poli38472_013622 [Pythium oligandrum]
MRTAGLSFVGASVLAVACSAYTSFVDKLPNGGAFPDAPAIGHPDPEGVQGLNEFGEDWNKLGKGSWTKKYCMADSDGDGYTNGQELGDPCCEWTPTKTGSLITEGISHPSDKNAIPTNPKLLEACSKSAGGKGGAAGGASGNSTEETTGDTGEEGPGEVRPSDEMPEDDDEDDSSESESLNAAPRSTVHAAVAVFSVVCSAVMFIW